MYASAAAAAASGTLFQPKSKRGKILKNPTQYVYQEKVQDINPTKTQSSKLTNEWKTP